MQKNYSTNITNAWKCYLEFQGFTYTFDEQICAIVFKACSSSVGEELEFTVKTDVNSYCVYAKLPLKLYDDKLNAVSTYINSANRDTSFAHFTLDYDTRTVYCVSGSFCDSKEIGFEEMDDILNQIYNFLKHHYPKLSLIAEPSYTGDTEEGTLPNTIGLDFFCKNYLDKRGIEYSLFSDDDTYNRIVYFSEDDIAFDMLIDDEYILASARGPALLFRDNETLNQVKEYLQRCNNENGLVWFRFYNILAFELNITCNFENFFSKDNISATLIDGVEEIKIAIKKFYPGLIEVASGKLTAKEAFYKYCEGVI